MTVTASQLRGNIYRLLDQVAETGRPLVIHRHGHELKIVPVSSGAKLDRLVKRDCIVGDPELLVHHDWTRDLYDRMIVAHAAVRNLPLLTKDDTILAHYRKAFWDTQKSSKLKLKRRLHHQPSLAEERWLSAVDPESWPKLD